MSLQTVAVALFLAVLYAIRAYRKRSRFGPLPGPPGYPVIGNVLDVPRQTPWVTYKQWSHQYNSDIIFLNLMGTRVAVINSEEVAVKLLEQRSTLYSDRPHSVMMHELEGWDDNFALMPYTERWRASRRAFHEHFNEHAIKDYEAQYLKYTGRVLRRLLDTPDRFLTHLRWMTGSLILELTYGFDIQDETDPFLVMADRAVEAASLSGAPGSFLVDVFPILKYIPAWVPGANFQRQAAIWKADVLDASRKPMAAVRDAMAVGKASMSMASNLLSKSANPDDKKEYEFVQAVAGATYMAGQDTTASTLQSFCLHMAMHPEIQRAAQEELDRVLEKGRLPELADRESLPFITAIFWEIIRFHPSAPLALPHKVMSDDVYEGYHIPAGTVVVCNVWAITHDEKVYSNPDKFDPYRFLSGNAKLEKHRERVFGIGRRMCPGRHLAQQFLWVTMARILTVFNINKAIDEHGKTIEPEVSYTRGLVSYPDPYAATFVPRSEAAAQLIRDTALAD